MLGDQLETDVRGANDLSVLLRAGALPAPLTVVEERTVGPELGADAIRAGLISLAFGAAFVFLYMGLAYGFFGWLANVALLANLVIMLGILSVMGATLTLPGIAGFLLAVAISLDTNILVFERLREEMAIQPNFSAALRAAFARAWTAILDSHVTTFIASSVLFFLGTGPVKGFALTLGIGVLLSLFSAISVTRLFMWSLVKVGEQIVYCLDSDRQANQIGRNLQWGPCRGRVRHLRRVFDQ